MNRRLVLFSCLFVFALVSSSYADLNLKNGSVIRFTDGSILSTAPPAAGPSAPADHGGVGNTVGGTNSFIGGGSSNSTSGDHATIGGGQHNTALAEFSTIGGGGPTDALNPTTTNNVVFDVYGTIGGGGNNRVGSDDADPNTGRYSTIGGGFNNRASGGRSTVGGGDYNDAQAQFSTIGGGGPSDALNPSTTNNVVYDTFGTVSGGANNRAGSDDADPITANFATVSGGWLNRASAESSTVGGGSTNVASGDGATVGGGAFGTASGEASTVGGGYINVADGLLAVISGGGNNTASGFGATIAGGGFHLASADGSTISGGGNNTANGPGSTVSGGNTNVASGIVSTVGGGYTNTASGAGSVVPGGNFNFAGGDHSFAAGRRAKISAIHDGTFLWADKTDVDLNSASANEFAVRATGGVRFLTNSTLTMGQVLGASDSSWGTPSSRTLKENYTDIDPVAILEKVAALSVQQWNYKAHEKDRIHIGPYAEDFWEAFGLNGEYTGRITSQDLDGVAFAAIQGLNVKLEGEVESLRSHNAALSARNDNLQARLEALEALVHSMQE